MRILSIFIVAAGSSFFAAQAYAGPQEHCELVSRDIADSRTSETGQWQTLFASAYEDCMSQYNATTEEDETSSAGEPVEITDESAVTEVVDEKPKAKVRKVILPASQAAVVSTKRPAGSKLEPGTAAWNEYCAGKYVSFSKETGLYRSMSGKQKPCKVTSGKTRTTISSLR